MTSGSTLANLTALWAARDLTGARRILASEDAHLSVRKAAHILGMDFAPIATDEHQRLREDRLPDSLARDILVLTAGTTGVGTVDPLRLAGRAAWTHVDAAWAGPLIYTERRRSLLDGIAAADSISISAHKLLFQPKESALIFFRDAERAHGALAFGGSYLSKPNIGVLGSHGAAAVSLVAMLLAWGRIGLAERLDHCIDNAERLADRLRCGSGFDVFGPPMTGVVIFKPRIGSVEEVLRRLPANLASTTRVRDETWLRCVSANPNADVEAIVTALERATAV